MTLNINEISIEKKAYERIKFPEGSLKRQFEYGDMYIGRDDSYIFIYNRNMARENQFGML